MLLFFALLVPYATSLVYKYFMDTVIQGFYEIIIIIVLMVNVGLRNSLGKVNAVDKSMLKVIERAKKVLYADIA